ncbi:hypothetical protein JTE90_029489 [Oedothorax gibbosus]|uniref:Uncharacterized protein n=1 Tax=Oedothorax gibbosus TaxID=931172 RepID=A0AAV6V541_9ARAC|nr:hypothetical protein JTE90_029489 [Oedothorax gibbosus]
MNSYQSPYPINNPRFIIMTMEYKEEAPTPIVLSHGKLHVCVARHIKGTEGNSVKTGILPARQVKHLYTRG